MKIAALVLLAAAAVPAVAQFSAVQDAVDGARARAAATSERARTLQSTLTAMNDGPDAGGRVVAALAAANITVHLAAQSAPAALATQDGARVILVSDALPARPRVYAPLIAAAAAPLLYSDMPACAEREYMRAATAARAFFELGGDFAALPIVDGAPAAAVKNAVWAWTSDAQTAVEEAGRRSGLRTLPELEAAAKDPKDAAALSAADQEFVSFLLDERDVRREAGR